MAKNCNGQLITRCKDCSKVKWIPEDTPWPSEIPICNLTGIGLTQNEYHREISKYCPLQDWRD